jgi:thioredoxin family protein
VVVGAAAERLPHVDLRAQRVEGGPEPVGGVVAEQQHVRRLAGLDSFDERRRSLGRVTRLVAVRPVMLVKVNVDESPKIQQRFGVQAIPTLMVLRRGQVATRRAGAAPAADLRKWVETAIAP